MSRRWVRKTDHPCAKRPSLVAVLVAGYWDLNRVLRALWWPAFVAFLLLSLCYAAAPFAAALFGHTLFGKIALKQAIQLGGLVLITPFLIAVHRFVLLGEVTPRYAIDVGSARFKLFAGWLAVLGLIGTVPSLILAATASPAPLYYVGTRPTSEVAPLVLILVAYVAAFAFLIRMSLLLPAVAIDAPGTVWQNAIADSRGSGWFIACASVLAGLPPILVYALIAVSVRAIVPWPLPALIVMLLALAALFFVTLSLGVAIASRLYQALGNRLNQPLRT